MEKEDQEKGKSVYVTSPDHPVFTHISNGIGQTNSTVVFTSSELLQKDGVTTPLFERDD